MMREAMRDRHVIIGGLNVGRQLARLVAHQPPTEIENVPFFTGTKILCLSELFVCCLITLFYRRNIKTVFTLEHTMNIHGIKDGFFFSIMLESLGVKNWKGKYKKLIYAQKG
jgi:hypothetical protein